MAHTHTDLLTHAIFSTANRVPFIVDAIRADLHAYIGGILREERATPLMVGGTSNHVHLLMRSPADLAVADTLRVVKTNSSRWVKERWPERWTFKWQRGYGAFSVSESKRTSVVRYIETQESHHRKMTYEDEFISFLKKHRVEYDERYLWR